MIWTTLVWAFISLHYSSFRLDGEGDNLKENLERQKVEASRFSANTHAKILHRIEYFSMTLFFRSSSFNQLLWLNL